MSTETATLYRDEVEMSHDSVYVYRGNGDSRADYSGFREDSHPLAHKCICHHAVWHSCPAPSVGRAMFESLPTRPVGRAPTGEMAAMRAELDSLRRRVSDLERRRR